MTLVSPDLQIPAHPPESHNIPPIPQYVDKPRVHESASPIEPEMMTPDEFYAWVEAQTAQTEPQESAETQPASTEELKLPWHKRAKLLGGKVMKQLVIGFSAELAPNSEVLPPLVTVEELAETAQEPAELSASQKLGQQLGDTLAEFGLADLLEQLETAEELPEIEADEPIPAVELFDQDAVEVVEEETEQDRASLKQRIKDGVLRGSTWLHLSTGKAAKNVVGKVQERRAQQSATAEEEVAVSNNERFKKYAKYAAAGAVMVAAAGVAVYLQRKGAEMISDIKVPGVGVGRDGVGHIGIGGSGSRGSGVGSEIGAAAARAGSKPQVADVAQGVEQAVPKGGGSNLNLVVNQGDMPWDVLKRAGVADDEIMGRLTEAAERMQVEQGGTFSWHGTGFHEWQEVNGMSDTPSVIDALKPYL